MGATLAIDAGQTGIKLTLVGGNTEFTAVHPGVQTHHPVLPQLAAAIRLAATEVAFDEVAIGTTGLTSSEHDASALHALVADLDIARVLLAHDSITSYLGALGDRDGVVVAAGTGSIILGSGPERLARVDGWGHLLGDGGSGYWIGREALKAVLEAFDGRGPETALTDVAVAEFPRLDDAYTEIQGSPDRVSRIAKYAAAVARLSTTDEMAARISRDAGRELARSAVAAARVVGLEAPAVALIGGVFRSEAVHAACVAALRETLPLCEIVSEAGDGIDGAATLPAVDPTSPLGARISRSR